nr:hypothetical protein [uncultured Sphingomonas sp.]
MRSLCILSAAVLVAGHAGPASAAENRVVRCNTAKAGKAPPYAGAALVANIPKSMTPIDVNAVQFTDRAMTRQVIVEGLFARRTPTNTVEVSARLVNCTDRPLQLLARSSFMDAVQYPVEAASAWTRVIIPARGTGLYREQSISQDEVGYYLIELAADQGQ